MPKIKLPLIGTPALLNRSPNQAGQKFTQPELQLDKLQVKKKQFYFTSDQLLAKPNDLLHDDNELSMALDNAKTELDMDTDLNKLNRNHHQHHHHSHHHHHHHRHHRDHHSKPHKHKGGKLTISANQVIKSNQI